MKYFLVSINGSQVEPLTYCSCLTLSSGDIVEVKLVNRNYLATVISFVDKPDFKCQEIISKTDTFFSTSQLDCAKFISEYYTCSLGMSLSLFTPFTKKIKELKNKEDFTLPILTCEQKKAFEFICQQNISLLFGDTGSGKTEIYISTICEVLQEGKNAIFLLPEIGLTPQLEERLKFYFHEMVGIWHSKITKNKKQELLTKIEQGVIRVVIGARSALFLPLDKVGLIIIDEEHDESYKANNTPRYNARDVALFYGKKIGAKVVLGSATPSVSIFPKVPSFRLKGNYYKSTQRVIYENHTSELTENMIDIMQKTIEKNEQIIVFLPTRANFKYITCKNCGSNVDCPYCSVSMSLHKNHNLLKCHYCNYTSRIVQNCFKCNSDTMEAVRLGTAEVVERLREFFADKVVEKFDRDEITTETKLRKVLKDFNSHKIDILVGTQMLSKGHDYHKVGLSVILGIDNILALSDFRAREKALSLAIQIAGRSGRKSDGVVFIQTKNEEFFMKYLTNYDNFIQDELSLRQELYPPYKKLLRLLISNKNDMKAKESMHSALDNLKNLKDIEIVGYGKADIEKIANKYRYNILLRSNKAKPLIVAALTCKNVNIQPDIDPVNFS